MRGTGRRRWQGVFEGVHRAAERSRNASSTSRQIRPEESASRIRLVVNWRQKFRSRAAIQSQYCLNFFFAAALHY
jgi:hypothetical protein